MSVRGKGVMETDEQLEKRNGWVKMMKILYSCMKFSK